MKHLSLHSLFLLLMLIFGVSYGCSDDAPVYTFPSRPVAEEPTKPDPEDPKPDDPKPDDPDPEDPNADLTDTYPKGLTVDFKEVELEGKKTKVWTAMVDFEANPKLRFNPLHIQPAKYPTGCFDYAKTLDIGTPYIATNAGYFYNGESLSLCVYEGKIESTPANGLVYDKNGVFKGVPVRAAFGQMDDGTFEATWCQVASEDQQHVYSFPSPLDNNEKEGIFMTTYPSKNTEGAKLWEPRNAIGGGPMLVYDGENVAMDCYYRECLVAGGTQGDQLVQRTAIGGTKDGKKMMLVVTGGRNVDGSAGLNLTQLADLFVEAGMDYAVNLDGGGSSTMVGYTGTLLTEYAGDLNESTGKRVQRAVPTAIVISRVATTD